MAGREQPVNDMRPDKAVAANHDDLCHRCSIQSGLTRIRRVDTMRGSLPGAGASVYNRSAMLFFLLAKDRKTPMMGELIQIYTLSDNLSPDKPIKPFTAY